MYRIKHITDNCDVIDLESVETEKEARERYKGWCLVYNNTSVWVEKFERVDTKDWEYR